MLRKEDSLLIQALRRRGVYIRDIAEQLDVHPKTVSRALRRGGPPRGHRRRRRGRLLEPYRSQVDSLLSEGVWNAVVIFREIQASGYKGGLTVLREYIQPKRVLRKKRTTLRFETRPGKQLQSDWGKTQTVIGGQRTPVHFIVNTLGYSRRFHFWCTDSEDAEHTYEGLVRSFEYFGGVSDEVLVDNQKAAVVEHRVGKKVRFNARFLDLAGHYGFRPRACQPGRPQTKGKDERNVGYIKQHFFVRYREFESWAHLNAQAELWLREEADARVHGTVKEVVAERFAREAPALRSLPRTRYDTAYHETRVAGWDALVDVRGNRYSVPPELAGQVVKIRITLDGQVAVYDGDRLVVTHRLKPAREGWVTVPEHHEALWHRTLQVHRRPLSVYEEVTTWS